MKKSEVLAIGAVAPLAIEIGAQTIYALSQGMGWASVPMGVTVGVEDYFVGGVLATQGLVDLVMHPGLGPLWNQYYGLSNIPQTLSPAATAVKAGAYVAIPSLSVYVADRGEQLFNKVKGVLHRGARNRTAS